MENKALEYLEKNLLLHVGIIEPIRRNTSEILYAEDDGVLIYEKNSKSYMLSVNNFEKGKELLNNIEECTSIAVHQNFMMDYVENKYKFTKKLECLQAVYLRTNKINIDTNMKIKPIEKNDKHLILEHYNSLTDEELDALLGQQNIFGGYINNELIGFIGMHLEGSMGILEIFPEFRRNGYGLILESYMVNKMMDLSLIPYGQVVVNNKKSMELQKKLDFKISPDKLYWLF